jgi:hypothetical protein
MDGIDPGLGADRRQLGMDLLGPETDHDRQLVEAERFQDRDMTAQQRLAAELEQAFGMARAIGQTHTPACRQHDRVHGVSVSWVVGAEGGHAALAQ